MKHIGLFAAAAGASLAIASPAAADPLQFVISGDYSASFVLDSNPVPDVVLDGIYFTLWDVPGFPDSIFDVADITFFNSSFDGGIQIEDFYGGAVLIATDGPQLYSGTEADPTFLVGTYNLTQFNGPGTYTLTISAMGGAVPEPAAWAMLIGGFGLAGSALRRRAYQKAKVSVAYA